MSKKSRIGIEDLGEKTARDLTEADMRHITGGNMGEMMFAPQQTQEMPDMTLSSNLQYLSCQGLMQGDNRQFTMMSNIMKTRHDTAKNAINNIR